MSELMQSDGSESTTNFIEDTIRAMGLDAEYRQTIMDTPIGGFHEVGSQGTPRAAALLGRHAVDKPAAPKPPTTVSLNDLDRLNMNCRNEDPTLFSPMDDEKRMATSRIKLAKEICKSCEALMSCRTYALQNPQPGVWGGMTEGERKALLRKTAKQ